MPVWGTAVDAGRGARSVGIRRVLVGLDNRRGVRIGLRGGAEVALSSYEALPLEEIRSMGPVASGGATLVDCEGQPLSAGELALRVEDADRYLGYSELEAAAALLEATVPLVVCAPELVERGSLWRMHFLLGLIRAYLEQEDAALGWFSKALLLDPGRDWDDAFAREGRPFALFVEAADRPSASAPLEVVPTDAASLRIDGAALPQDGLQLGEGLHYLTYGRHPSRTLGVHIQGGAGRLVLPSLIADDVLGRLPAADPDSRALHAILSHALPAGTDVYVSTPGTVWTARTPDLAWQALTLERPSSAGPAVATLVAGAIVAAAGGTTWAWSYGTGSARASDAEAAQRSFQRTRYEQAIQGYTAAQRGLSVGAGLAIGGATVAGIGGGWWIARSTR